MAVIGGEGHAAVAGTPDNPFDQAAIWNPPAQLKERFRVGSIYQGQPSFQGGNATAAPTLTSLTAIPFLASTTIKIDQLGFGPMANSGAGGLFRVGIYRDDGMGSPSALVFDGGTIVADAGAVNVFRMTATFAVVTLRAGLYWLAGVATVAAGTIRQYGANWPSAAPVGVTAPLPNPAGSMAGYIHNAVVAGALPDPFVPDLTQTSVTPASIAVRIAA